MRLDRPAVSVCGNRRSCRNAGWREAEQTDDDKTVELYLRTLLKGDTSRVEENGGRIVGDGCECAAHTLCARPQFADEERRTPRCRDQSRLCEHQAGCKYKYRRFETHVISRF